MKTHEMIKVTKRANYMWQKTNTESTEEEEKFPKTTFLRFYICKMLSARMGEETCFSTG